MRSAISLIIALAACACTPGESPSRGVQVVDGVPFIKVQTKRLPDMNHARHGHIQLTTGKEMVVMGGHTTGFTPDDTAEWFDGEKWNLIPMAYPHDGSFMAILEDGRAMVGGGSGDSFGIGQSWGVELYNPDTHSFDPLTILDRKRAYPTALVLPTDTVIVSGNWCGPDAIEIYVPGKGFSFFKDVSEPRISPYILQSAPGEVIVFGAPSSPDGHPQGIVDRLHGEPFSPELLKEWSIFSLTGASQTSHCCIGNYTYLIPCRNSDNTRVAMMKVSGETFSLLEVEQPFPTFDHQGQKMYYSGRVLINRTARQAFLFAGSKDGRIYMVEVNYDATLDGGKAGICVHYSDSAPDLGIDYEPAFTPGGNILLTGGFLSDYFHPSSAAVLVMLTSEERTMSAWWIIFALLFAIGIAAAIVLWRKRRDDSSDEQPANSGKDMMSRITALMEEEQLYRKKDLRLVDVASRLGTNTTYISACINGQTGQSFNAFVTAYRIQHAKELLKSHPELFMAQISDESGFTSERSFFRNFKAITGVTPSEWKEQK